MGSDTEEVLNQLSVEKHHFTEERFYGGNGWHNFLVKHRKLSASFDKGPVRLMPRIETVWI